MCVPGVNGAHGSTKEPSIIMPDHSQPSDRLAMPAQKSRCTDCWGDGTRKQLAHTKLGAIRCGDDRLSGGTVGSVHPGEGSGLAPDPAHGWDPERPAIAYHFPLFHTSSALSLSSFLNSGIRRLWLAHSLSAP